MKKEFEAYYSKAYAWIFASLVLLFLFGIVMLSVFWTPGLSLPCIILLSVLSLVFVYLFILTMKKDGVAVQVSDQTLLLYKRGCVEIPLHTIVKCSLHDGDGSFDISVKTPKKTHRMHCFIKEQRKKKAELIALLEGKGVPVFTFDI